MQAMFILLVVVVGVALAMPQSYGQDSLVGIPDTSNLANLLERMISASAKAGHSSSASQTPEDRQKDAQTLAQSLDQTIVFLERLSQIPRQQQSGGSYQ
ncbi:hypothetical protein Pmani_015589 [Petrolisthes manimaculis]|uniref:Uncharacterized protein n=1 Tax=Petrolisthes manimaculis TaxID=1843537 RepID=A0AAE1UBG1_9EUCA|nr:hypothetical protein Pmani_015589 [Petrolisthes manimaculis]